MLIDKYLPAYDFNEFHTVEIDSQAKDIYQKMLNCDFSKSYLIKLLFKARGIPEHLYNIRHLTKMGFTELEEDTGTEIIFGMVTESPMFNSCKPGISPGDFLQTPTGSVIKAVINFTVQPRENLTHSITTETRVWCSNGHMKTKFRFYWFFVKPFSGFVRKSMLREIKRQIAASGSI